MWYHQSYLSQLRDVVSARASIDLPGHIPLNYGSDRRWRTPPIQCPRLVCRDFRVEIDATYGDPSGGLNVDLFVGPHVDPLRGSIMP